MELTVIAIDIAKKVFQLHWVERDTGSIERLKLKRAQMLPWFANRQPAVVMMEACGGAHEWGRQLLALGHEVRLMPPKTVRPFVQRNKTDAADAQAIWTAGQQPGAKFVAVKNDAQQVVLSLHRLRAQLMKTRIMQTNELRGLLYEFGVVLSEGHRALLKELPAALLEAQVRLPAMLTDSLNEQVRRINDLDADINDRAPSVAATPGHARMQDAGGDPGRGSVDGNGDCRQHGFADGIQRRAGVCRLDRPGAQADRHRRARAATRDKQTR